MTAKTEPKNPTPVQRFCRCERPVGDPRQGTCILCGRQVEGTEMPHKDWR